MFTSDILLTGKHAYYTKVLAPREKENSYLKVFDRYIDVYMAGAIIGFINGKREETDRDSEYKDITASIMLDTIQTERSNLEVIYRTIMLLDSSNESNKNKSVDRAFRDDINEENATNHQENMDIYRSYVRGGISILYEKIGKSAVDRNELLYNMNSFVKDFYSNFVLDLPAKEEIDIDADIT